MPDFLTDVYRSAQNPDSSMPAIILVWTLIGTGFAILIWPRGRTLSRQLFALATLAFREGLRLKVLWTVLLLSLIPGGIAYFSDADGTHAGRARLILDTCISSGELLGAALIVLLSALSVAREIESRIMHTMGAKPVPRWTILAGKAVGFWAIDLCFLAILTLYCAALVRAIPLRAEARAPSSLEASGTWDDLRRNALTTRLYNSPQTPTAGPGGAAPPEFVFVRPGKSREWVFEPPPVSLGGQRSVRFSIGSNNSFIPYIQNVRIVIAPEGKPPIIDRTETIPQNHPFEFFLDPEKTPPGRLKVTLTAPAHATTSRFPPVSLILSRSTGVRMGVAADGFAANLGKSFFLMAIQGWILAIVTASWSGVLSFPVTVALGVIMVMTGEMSRHVIELLNASNLMQSGLLDPAKKDALQTETIQSLQRLLSLFPDFQAAGGPSAFVDGKHVSTFALAHAALWMGILRGVGWALPGIWAFQRREVGK